MACIENVRPSEHVDSEREEGEIVDDLDDLSDISSEEEFLLRQRLQVLENYNNVLERKKAKTSCFDSGEKYRREDDFARDLSEISATDLEEAYPHVIHRDIREIRHSKTHHKQKRRKELHLSSNLGKNKDHRKKSHRNKKKIEVKVTNESSDESDDEYRNKRRKLENAVTVNKIKNDTSSLKTRLTKMLYVSQNSESVNTNPIGDNQNETEIHLSIEDACSLPNYTENLKSIDENDDGTLSKILDNDVKSCDIIDLCNSDENKPVGNEECIQSTTVVKLMGNEEYLKGNEEHKKEDSDEDLELLRQHALKTKASKINSNAQIELHNKALTVSEDEDSDTTELRLICLKSAWLKKAIEAKQKQKLRKRLSQSSNLNDDFLSEHTGISNNSVLENNTDIESVDMDIGSDQEEKEVFNDSVKDNKTKDIVDEKPNIENDILISTVCKEDELEEDEDLLRAKLLTSLSKNLPHLVDPNVINDINDQKSQKNPVSSKTHISNVTEQKKLIIKLGDSDSEDEHEATKNLTKMHMKLSEQVDFQQKLDMFLKSTRMKVEKKKLPDVVQQSAILKPTEKFVPKVVNHLPKSEQIEYKNLVKRMAELEKMKQARQSPVNLAKTRIKETLKPRNVCVDSTVNNIDEQIAMSRKKIAEESAKMLKLKEEATKLSQKYKIVATELRNITTAITLNKKEQRSAQIRLSKIRAQHQMLLTSSIYQHSNTNHIASVHRPNNKIVPTTRLQKENNPTKEEFSNILKSVRVSVINDLKDGDLPNPRLSVQLDVSSNKKVVKMPKSQFKERIIDIKKDFDCTNTKEVLEEDNVQDEINLSNGKEADARHPIVEKGGGNGGDSAIITTVHKSSSEEKWNNDDYKSPLEALQTTTWEEDPNAVLCPFEVSGNCKDPDCKYLHPKILSKQ